MTTSNAIEVSNLSVMSGNSTLLSDLSFECRPGEHLAIIGSNGAGKTTLLRSLMGLLSFQGTIRLEEDCLSSLPRRDLARKVAYVPQHLSDSIPFTVREFIQMARYPHQVGFGIASDEDHSKCEDLMVQTGVEKIADRPLSTLSGGERQRVSISAALAQECSILILDEPCSHLDPRQQSRVQALLAEIKSDHDLTMLTVTHDLNWVSFSADRVLALREGRRLHLDTPERILQRNSLEQIFDTSFQLLPHPETGRPLILPEHRLP